MQTQLMMTLLNRTLEDTSLVEDTCQCLGAKYLMMSKLLKAKENSQEIYSLLVAWKILFMMYH